ncbi:Maf-like protein [Chitinivorax sp. PXF-14]|uniref:Maf-like protein n=1 Tax=Chitinivorax sp. PXF-14 TaxID=3230488 RepID=UPI003466C261
MTRPTLVLGSTSPYRKELLSRLDIPFEVASPDTDETPLPGELPHETALRLAEAKARSLAARFPDALIIGSDQVATLDGRQIGKPGTHERAVEQLRFMRGRTVAFHTAIALFNSRTGKVQLTDEITEVRFRHVDDDFIEAYLRKEQPYNCAGSAKSEGLGIVLIESMRGDDPNALIGLPLIRLISMLNNEGFPLF